LESLIPALTDFFNCLNKREKEYNFNSPRLGYLVYLAAEQVLQRAADDIDSIDIFDMDDMNLRLKLG
jgi:hypothetical protein